jgi:hypothetical protein
MSAKVYVGNLPFSVKSDGLKEMFSHMARSKKLLSFLTSIQADPKDLVL